MNLKNLFGGKGKSIANETINNYSFLADMYRDNYFPNFLVDKGVKILMDVCYQIEKKSVKNLDDLYKITHAATEKFNELEDEFGENGSEIETVAREAISIDFLFIANAYRFEAADIEELVAPRDW